MVILDLGDFLNHHLCLIIDVMLNRDWRSGKLVCSPGGLGAGEFELLNYWIYWRNWEFSIPGAAWLRR